METPWIRTGTELATTCTVVRTACTTLLALAFAIPAAAQAEWGPGAEVEWKGPQAKLQLTGYAQSDFRRYRDWDVEDGLRSDEQDVPRRARIGLAGEWKRFSFEAQADPADGAEHLKDLWGELRLHRALRVRAGNMKVPVSAEWLTSAARTDFVERTRLADDLGPGRDWGVMAHGRVGDHAEYQAGLFKGDDRTGRIRAGTTGAARLVLSPWKDLDLGGSFSLGGVEADPETVDAETTPRGLRGETPVGLLFSAPRYVNGNRRRIGLEATWAHGPVGFKAEALEAREQRKGQGSACGLVGSALACDDLPDVRGRGWSLSATWLLTGDKKKRAIEPAEPLLRGGAGAIELGVRAESIRFDDTGEDTGFAGVGERARNIRRTGEDAFTAGLSWWAWSWTRLMGNVVVERFFDPLLAPEPGRRGNYVTLLMRVQIQVP